MAGYNYAQGMSNNAVAAYQNGAAPLSKITITWLRDVGWKNTKSFAVWLAKRGTWSASEWHHSGGTWYNQVDFYDPDVLVEMWEDMTPDEQAELFRLHKSPLKKQDDIKKVKGTYTIWGGSRKRPQKVGEEEFTGELRGNWIFTNKGERKKASGNHIRWEYMT